MKKRHRTLLILWVLLGSTTSVALAKKSKAAATVSTKAAGSSKASTNVLQITETEVWDGEKWKAGDHRWTKKNDRPTKSPDKQKAPRGNAFDGDWKIVTSSSGSHSRDSYGWEYVVAKPHPIRRRVWLRSMVPSKQVSRRPEAPFWMQRIRDDWNFKGYGWTFYKSMLATDSFGAAFRLPLTFNFDSWDRNPALPSISTSLCLWHPYAAILYLNGSLRVEWIKWIMARTWALSTYLSLWLVWSLFRGLAIALSALVFPVTRRLWNPPLPLEFPRGNPCVYSRNVEERLGCSLSWRVSKDSGYEFRVSYWHYYAPTLTSICEALSLTQLFTNNKPPAWFARRSGAIGLSTGAPVPDAPYVSCSAILSLSGYYFEKSSRDKTVSEALRSSPGEALPATAILQIEDDSEEEDEENKAVSN